jgi:hypothetical protein
MVAAPEPPSYHFENYEDDGKPKWAPGPDNQRDYRDYRDSRRDHRRPRKGDDEDALPPPPPPGKGGHSIERACTANADCPQKPSRPVPAGGDLPRPRRPTRTPPHLDAPAAAKSPAKPASLENRVNHASHPAVIATVTATAAASTTRTTRTMNTTPRADRATTGAKTAMAM